MNNRHMYEHINNIKFNYGENAYVQIPNEIFYDLSKCIKNAKQIFFSYSYLILHAFLYKYTHYVDFTTGTYIQNADAKQILGYKKETMSIDSIIKRGGLLDTMGLTTTTKDYPVRAIQLDEAVNQIPMIDFITIKEMDDDMCEIYKGIVKNRNYTIKIPNFLFQYNDNTGTLYQYEYTHCITIKEFIHMIYDTDISIAGMFLYGYFKSKCYGLKDNMRKLRLSDIVSETGISHVSFFKYLDKMVKMEFLHVNHKGWKSPEKETPETNEYFFKCIK